MIVQLRVSDELYEKYAKRNPQNPRKALEEALEAWQDAEPGIPRLVVENPELRRLKELSGQVLSDSKELVTWAEKTAAASVAGVDLPLSLGQRQRLVAQAQFFQQPLGEFIQKQFNALVVRELGA